MGTLARAVVASAATSWGLASLWWVLAVNLVGALILGWYAAHVRGSKRWSTITVGFVAAGVLGSFTTFSAFSLEVVELYESGAWLAGSAYAFASVAAGLSAAIAGRRLAGPR
jgi:CrcB protein